MSCFFEKITKYEADDITLPQRKTKFSAGYDICAAEDITIPSHLKTILSLLGARLTAPDVNISEKIATILEKMTADFEGFNSDTSLLQNPDDMISKFEALKETSVMDVVSIGSSVAKALDMEYDEIVELCKSTKNRATLIPTGIKCCLDEDKFLKLNMRSSTPLNSYLVMPNSTGIVDADYYNNENNEGHIFIQVMNLSPFNITVKKGTPLAQGIISSYHITDDDTPTSEIRTGGFGSTNE